MVADAAHERTLVLVHGAWHGAWAWELLVPELAARGWRTSTVDLPSASGDPEAGMYRDAEIIREHLAGIDGPITVLAHSYGGLPVTEVAATVPRVTQLIYLAAHMLDVGEYVLGPTGGPWFDPEETPLLPVPDSSTVLMYADVAADVAEAAVARLRPQSSLSFLEPLTRAAWRRLPSAFVVCDEDRIFPPVLAETLPPKADLVRHMPTSHSPFLSRPAELAELISEISAALAVLPDKISN
ncbi:alpha/beta fold hydrolase [Pseudonocardia xinjiangensis]|uniref:alpha/beta fold hydrolase n=1 Tax=Pseudonocardia xinjiangensis TaxID=75289 RepID=UPI003D8FDE43